MLEQAAFMLFLLVLIAAMVVLVLAGILVTRELIKILLKG